MNIKENVLTRGKATGGGIRFRKKRMIKTRISSEYVCGVFLIEEVVVSTISSEYVCGVFLIEGSIVAAIASAYSLAVA